MNALELKICDIQGRLFELSAVKGFDSEDFIDKFMKSDVAKNLDSSYNRMQWAGEEYLMEEISNSCAVAKGGAIMPMEVLYWTGYIFRYWHYITGESSRQILKQAPPKTMNTNYLMFHSVAPELAIEDLKEIYRQK